MQPDRPAQSTLAFHSSRIVIDVGVLLAMASMSMTFVIAPGGDRSALEADALPAVLLLLPIFVVTLIPDHTRPLHPGLGWLSLVLALAAVPYALVKLLDAHVLADTLGGSVGLGPRLLLAGCLVTLVGVGIGLVRDLMGWPSGGTPGRSTTYRSKRAAEGSPRPARRPPSGTTTTSPQAHAAPDEATSVVTVPDGATEEDGAIGPDQPDTVGEPGSTDQAEADPPSSVTLDGQQEERTPSPSPQQRPTSFGPSHPEIVFPDTEAIAPDADPEEEEYDHLLDTAERADAALTDHLRTMFDKGADTEAEPGPGDEES